jgi:kynureninase
MLEPRASDPQLVRSFLPLTEASYSDWFAEPSVSYLPEKEDSAYLCGNSLGLLPRLSEKYVLDELQVWGSRYVNFCGGSFRFPLHSHLGPNSAVQGHFDHPLGREWTKLTDHVHPLMAELVGAWSSFGSGNKYSH